MSARVTRQSKRIASLSTSATATPVSFGSPVSSTKALSAFSETPITSDGLDDVDAVLSKSAKTPKLKGKASETRVSARGKGKRKAETEDEEVSGDDSDSIRAPKRRAVSSRIYVEVPKNRTRGSQKVCSSKRIQV